MGISSRWLGAGFINNSLSVKAVETSASREYRNHRDDQLIVVQRMWRRRLTLIMIGTSGLRTMPFFKGEPSVVFGWD